MYFSKGKADYGDYPESSSEAKTVRIEPSQGYFNNSQTVRLGGCSSDLQDIYNQIRRQDNSRQEVEKVVSNLMNQLPSEFASCKEDIYKLNGQMTDLLAKVSDISTWVQIKNS